MRLPTTLLALIATVCLWPAAVPAQTLADYDYENLTFRGVGVDVGRIWPNKVEPASIWSVRLDLGYLGPAVRLMPTISYWSSRFRKSELDRLADRLSDLPPLRQQGVTVTGDDLGDIHWSDLVLGLDAHVVWTAPLNIITFVGGGLAVHALNGRGDVIDDTFIEDLLDSTAPGAAVLAGFELQVAPGVRIYAETRYTLASDVRYPSIRVGGALMLPTGQ
jgi:hypothetical protein